MESAENPKESRPNIINTMNEYFVQKLEESGIYMDYTERYAFMRNDVFGDICGHPMLEASPKELGGYLEITNVDNSKKIYRKYRGRNIVEDNHVMLDYRTICELQLPKEPELRRLHIKKSTWWKYYLLNSDPGISSPAWLAIAGLTVTMLSLIISIVFYLFSNCC